MCAQTVNPLLLAASRLEIFEKAKFDGKGAPIADLVVHACLAASKGAARKDFEAGGIYLGTGASSLAATHHESNLSVPPLLCVRDQNPPCLSPVPG